VQTTDDGKHEISHVAGAILVVPQLVV